MFKLLEVKNGEEVVFPLDLIINSSKHDSRTMIYIPNIGPMLLCAKLDYIKVPCFIPEELIDRCEQEMITSCIKEAKNLNLLPKKSSDSLVKCKQNGKYGLVCFSIASLLD